MLMFDVMSAFIGKHWAPIVGARSSELDCSSVYSSDPCRSGCCAGVQCMLCSIVHYCTMLLCITSSLYLQELQQSWHLLYLRLRQFHILLLLVVLSCGSSLCHFSDSLSCQLWWWCSLLDSSCQVLSVALMDVCITDCFSKLQCILYYWTQLGYHDVVIIILLKDCHVVVSFFNSW